MNTQDLDLKWKKKLIFSGVFVHENMLHAIMDRYLKDMTCKQWLVMVVSDAFPSPPDLSTIAKNLGCSRQNIKKLALSLEKMGYVSLENSEEDSRSLLVKITEKGKSVIENSKELEDMVHCSIFGSFSDEEVDEYFRLSRKMEEGFGRLEECFSSLKEKGAL